MIEDAQNLALPDVSSTSLVDSDACTLKIDHLGPIIINTDGTMSRIANWNEMTEKERYITVKRITARNIQRKMALQSE